MRWWKSPFLLGHSYQVEQEMNAWIRQGLALLENYANRHGEYRV